MIERRNFTPDEVLFRNFLADVVMILVRRIAARDAGARGFLLDLANHHIPSLAGQMEAESAPRREIEALAGKIRAEAHIRRPRRKIVIGQGGQGSGHSGGSVADKPETNSDR